MLTQDEIKTIFTYKDGKLYWNYRTPTSKVDKIFNTKYAGNRAGYLHKTSGYWRINYDHVAYEEHLLVYILFEGFQPNKIDHIDNIRTNNFRDNLRPSDDYENTWNSKKSLANTSGFKGVTWHNKAQKWQGRLMHKGKSISVGLHDIPEEAVKALSILREDLHKEFSNNG